MDALRRICNDGINGQRWIGVVAAFGVLSFAPASVADTLNGQVLGAGAPIANSTVTLYAAGAGAPSQLVQAKTGADGRFTLSTTSVPPRDASLYLVAKGGKSSADKSSGDNPAIALIAILGNYLPAKVTINEMTTVASVWTNAQFLDGATLKGPALPLKIAAGNVPSFVDTGRTTPRDESLR